MLYENALTSDFVHAETLGPVAPFILKKKSVLSVCLRDNVCQNSAKSVQWYLY